MQKTYVLSWPSASRKGRMLHLAEEMIAAELPLLHAALRHAALPAALPMARWGQRSRAKSPPPQKLSTQIFDFSIRIRTRN